jgi:hypothetical protein
MAGSGFWAATIPAQNSRITTITDTITIPVQADIMAVDLTVEAITVAAAMAGINSCNSCLKLLDTVWNWAYFKCLNSIGYAIKTTKTALTSNQRDRA